MRARGWRPVGHLSRDFGLACAVAAIVFGIRYLPENGFLTSSPTGISKAAILIGVGAISGALTGTSIVAMTIVVGWWKVGRLSIVTSIPVFESTLLLLLKTSTWMLAILTILSILLAVLPLTPKAETFVIPIYGALVATTVNYFRRTVTVLYSAAALVTKTIDD